uniref:Transcription factor Jun n=1 Tax=Salarias fasciatus TaxID=181472 RepID=A0A672IP98_SALFA
MSRKMEATFYDEAVNASNSQRDGAAALDILTSPDVGLLKLASPELERLIIQSCTGLTTPTPTQFICPKNITDEQEGFADGFVRALAELHYQQQVPAAHPDAQTAPPSPSRAAPLPRSPGRGAPRPHLPARGSHLPATTPRRSRPTATWTPSWARRSTRAARAQGGAPDGARDVRETPPLSPIDMESQERIKAERKRMRNRVAASKCRKRKLERISRLEDRVKNLKSQNTELVSSANILRDELALLKQKVMDHVNSGCQLILTQQLQAY